MRKSAFSALRRADLATGFYHVTRGWIDAQLAPLRSLLGSVNLARA